MDDMVGSVYIILQARMNSKRLPGKVMKSIAGKPMIGILIDRLEQSELPIILATSINIENDTLADYAKSLGVLIYRGSEENVLERYYFAAKSVEANVVIRVTGDNPLLDGKFLRDQVVLFLSLKDSRAYLSTSLSQTWPLGISVEIFSFELLEEAYHNSALQYQKEHVTPYMHQNVPGDIKIIAPRRNESRYHYRLTVDTEDDYILNCKLIEELGCEKKTIEEIIQIIDNNKDLTLINKSIKQKKWNNS
jgi:spore coat polysaccharide biosynthesis protein SpsF